MRKLLYLAELNCDACELVLRKISSRHGVSVHEVDFSKKSAVLEGESADIDRTVSALNAAGYACSFDSVPHLPSASKRVTAFIKGAFFSKPGYHVEAEALLLGGSVFALVLAASLAVSFAGLLPLSGAQLYYAILSALGISWLGAVGWQVQAYRSNFSHMSGMMVGMTLGMAAGFLAGAIIGATNGMFAGSLVGMAAGMALGGYLGYCCGVMGLMEGLMGGVMAGTMGAMLSVMMVFDHLDAFLALLFASFAAILFALSYMVYKDNRGLPATPPQKTSAYLLALVVQLALLLIIHYVPRAASAVIWR